MVRALANFRTGVAKGVIQDDNIWRSICLFSMCPLCAIAISKFWKADCISLEHERSLVDTVLQSSILLPDLQRYWIFPHERWIIDGKGCLEHADPDHISVSDSCLIIFKILDMSKFQWYTSSQTHVLWYSDYVPNFYPYHKEFAFSSIVDRHLELRQNININTSIRFG